MLSIFVTTHTGALTPFLRATVKAIEKASLLLFSVALLLAGSAAVAHAQSALDGFDPNADGVVRVVVVQPDGKILIGGDFTTVLGVARSRIARLNPDGTLDAAFDPNANNFILAIALQADGKVLVSGGFNNIGGQPRNGMARLDAVTGLPDSFNPNPNGSIRAIAVQADGKILVGGDFNGANSIGGQTHNFIARLDVTGSADSFDPNANNIVRAIVVQADGKILVGGDFNGANSIGGQTRNHIARLDSTTGLADSFDPNANSYVRAIAVQADGKILVGGEFNGANSIGGQSRSRIARLEATTGLADSFNPNANGEVKTIVVQPDGKILAGGNFFNIGGPVRPFIGRLDPVTGLADSFNPTGDTDINSIAVQQDGKIVAGGFFTSLAPNGQAAVTRNRIARLEKDGRLDRTLNLSTVGTTVRVTAVQPDGKIIIGGVFSQVLGVTRNNIARLNTDGTLDTGFDPNANTSVLAIAVQADGKILAGGEFTSIGGQLRNFIARLDATTGLADSFDPNANLGISALALQADGKILAGGLFTNIGGQPRNYIARLDANTGLADSFNPNASHDVRALAVQSDVKVLAGGLFISIGGQPRNFIARLDGTTGLADSFNPNSSDHVFAIALQTDGKVLAGGQFGSIGGQPCVRLARLDATTGAADPLFTPNASDQVLSIAVQADGKILAGGFFNGTQSIGGANRNFIARLDPTTGAADTFNPNADGIVPSIALQADGKILAGGGFTNIGGQPRSLFARLTNDTAALQNLAVTQTSAAWTLGGASPQFTRVTFEYSNNNVNYSPLGDGTASGGTWTRSGLSLSTGINFYVRARGYYRSGHRNGSESTEESVRNAFIAGPTAADATISGQITTSWGAALGGVLVRLSGAKSAWTLTDSKGNYRFENVDTDNFYTVTPVLANYSFSPANRSFSLLGNHADAVFTAVPNTAPVGNAIDTSEYFVRQQYLDFLGREPDQGGLEYWNEEIARCGNDTDCISKRRIDVSASFFMAKEFQETGAFIYGLYKASFGNQPSYKQFTADRAKVVGGLDLEARKNALAEEWVHRDNFRQAYPDSMTAEQFVNKLFESAGLVPHTGEWETYVRTLNNGGTRAEVMRSLVSHPDFTAKEFNATFVLMEYFAYLRRDPDPGGYAFWLDVLNREPGNFRGMVCSFITSAEYQKRFGSVIAHSNGECAP